MSQRISHGNGLYLYNKASGSSWVFMYKFKGKRSERGLGSAKEVSEAQAKKKVRTYRAQLELGIDPFAVVEEPAVGPTFSKVALDLIENLRTGWKNEKHAQQWGNTLRTHAASIWDAPINRITTEDVLQVLTPIWTKNAETATRVRARIEKVLDAAKVRGLREGDNPARWKGHLEILLPKRKPSGRSHHAAMPYGDLPAFVTELRSRPALSARALEFLILTAARTGEIIKATAAEFDLEEKLWTVPADRMKAGAEHRVPLTDRAVELVKHVLFLNPNQPFGMSNMAMKNLLCRMDLGEYTPHGFRSAFRDWVGEETEFPREVAEAALAHQVGNAVERAYRRGDALAKRRELMQAWGAYLASA